MKSKDELITLACDTATKVGLDPALVCAVCEQESSWNPWAIRYEPAFYTRYVVPIGLKNITEAQGRAFSWGLMQTMGLTAREHGFSGNLASLCDPEVGIPVGCDVLIGKLHNAHGDVRKGLLLWNGGGNLHYPDEVLARVSKYQAKKPL